MSETIIRTENHLTTVEVREGYPRGTKDFKGILGKFKMLMFQWQDGKKSIVWPEETLIERARADVPQAARGRDTLSPMRSA